MSIGAAAEQSVTLVSPAGYDSDGTATITCHGASGFGRYTLSAIRVADLNSVRE